MRFPEVLAQMQGRYRSVMVDEFQDVSLAQSEMMDLLTATHRNYMAIGDDDQTIYGWRGADTRFILGFAERYGASKYLISDNFRSQASHLALANRVIEKNVHREPKRLSLTRGFGGGTYVHMESSAEGTGVHIAELIEQAFRDGRGPADLAVLVRLYAQTPFIEHALIKRRIPYRIVGSTPFYQRPEVLTLLAYLRLAMLERQLQAGLPLTDEQVKDSGAHWKQVINRPTRFVSQAIADSAWRSVTLHGATLSRAILVASGEAAGRVAANMHALASALKWIAASLDSLSAYDLLLALDARIGYSDYLKVSSGFPETGEARAAGVRGFIAYSQEKGSASEFLEHLDYISFSRIGKNNSGKGDGGKGEEDEADAVPIMTAFRAKGLQWPVVFVPDCNKGTFPCRTEGGLEEERRLFYVAITRPREVLHLHAVQGIAISQFLQEADWEETLSAVESVRAALEKDPEEWRTQDALSLARHTPALGLSRYFEAWWDAPPDLARRVARGVQWLLSVARRRGISGALSLTEEHGRLWEMFGRPTQEAPETHFADLERFIPRQEEEAATQPAPGQVAANHGGLPGLLYEAGQRVVSPQYGIGTILAKTGSKNSPQIVVQFSQGEPVTFLAKFAELEIVGEAA